MTTVLESDATTVFARIGQPYAITETSVAPPSKLRSSRLLKPCGGCAALGLSTYTVLQDVADITTNNAVIAAYTVAPRTDIDGADQRAHPTRVRADVAALATPETVLVEETAALAVLADLTGGTAA